MLPKLWDLSKNYLKTILYDMSLFSEADVDMKSVEFRKC